MAQAANELNAVGASGDYVYEVEPTRPVTAVNFGWFGRVLGEAASRKNLRGNKAARRFAQAYWSGAYFPYSRDHGSGAWEYIVPSFVVLRSVRA